jgi:hypothetical protein
VPDAESGFAVDPEKSTEEIFESEIQNTRSAAELMLVENFH